MNLMVICVYEIILAFRMHSCNPHNKCIIRQLQRKTQTIEIEFWNTTTIFIKQNVKIEEGVWFVGN